MRLLVVEDYTPLRKSLTRGLAEAGFAVDATGDGEEGLWFARDEAYDVIILDLMLPTVDGWEILRRLRREGIGTHVLILTARDVVGDRVGTLNAGADDYLVKPFAFEELLARVNALIRRKYGAKDQVLRLSDLEIDRNVGSVHRSGRLVELTAREYQLLEFLALRAGETVTRTEIEGHLYAFDAEPSSNAVDVFIRRIRCKLEAGGHPRLLHTRRGVGYILKEPE
ncbi:MAG: response regulator [Anaerolineaceae bacterium]|nr:response regulator [Anaerolineaceae bacterium]